MEIGSRGFPIIGNNREAEKVYNPEIRDFFSPLSVGTGGGDGLTSVLSSVGTTDVDAAGIKANSDSANGTDTGAVPASSFSFPPLKTDLNTPAESSYPNFSSFKESVPPLAGLEPNREVETEPASDQATFDDMVVVKDGMVTSAPLSDVASGDTFEQFQSSDAPLQESQEAPALSLEDRPADENGTPTVTQAAVEGNKDAYPLEAAVEASIEEPALALEVEPAGVPSEATAMQQGNLGGVIESQQEQLPPDVGNTEQLSAPEVTVETTLMKVPVAVRSELPFEKPPEDQRPQDGEPAVVSIEVSEQDVQTIKGQKVMKKFGRKGYVGDVVDFDRETKWFKVLYEDGDQEDLELAEVKEILVAPGTSPSSTKRKRPRSQGATDEEPNISPKKTKKTAASKKKNIGRLQEKRGQQESGKKKGRSAGTKGVSKSPMRAKAPGAKGKSSTKFSELREPKRVPAETTSKEMQEEKVKSQAKPDALDSLSSKVPGKSQMEKERKGKEKEKKVTPKSTKSGPSKSSKVGHVSGSKVHALEPQKEGPVETPVESPDKKKGKRRHSLRSPGKGKKVNVTPKKLESEAKRKAAGDEITEVKRKRLEKGFPEGESLPSGQDISKVGEATFIGKPVRKDFGGRLYDGVVVKYDKKRKYFKVKYDDGDQEDLEWRELDLILVSEETNGVDAEEKPAKISSLSALMFPEKKAGTFATKKTRLK